MLTARDVQIIVDVLPLLQKLSAIERVHEDRSLPTMALVLDSVQKFHSVVREFVQEHADVPVLRGYGDELLCQADVYFSGSQSGSQCIESA